MNHKDWIQTSFIENAKLWAVTVGYEFFYEYNINQQSIDKIHFFPEEIRNGKTLFGGILKLDQKLFFIPLHAKYLVIYEIDRDNYRLVDLKPDGGEKGEAVPYLCYTSCILENRLIMFSTDYIISYDLKTECVAYDRTSHEILCHLLGKEQKMKPNYSVYQDKLLFSTDNSNALVLLKSNLEVEQVIEVGAYKDRYTAPVFDGDSYWMMLYAAEENVIVRYQRKQTSYYRFQNEKKCLNYIGAAIIDDEVWFFPSNCGGKLVSIDKNDCIVREKALDERTENWYSFTYFINDKEKIHLYEISSSSIFVFEHGEWKKIKICFNETYNKAQRRDFYRRRRAEEKWIPECKNISIEGYIEELLDDEKKVNHKKETKIGKEIYQLILK